MGRFDIRTRTGQISPIIQTAVASSFDLDAQAFFDRVSIAGGALSTTEQNAVNTLTLSLKSAGVWTLMKAIYPMVGASAAACAQNLKSSSFTGTFTSGFTFASTGVTPNGSIAYMATGLIPSVNLGLNNASISVYLRTNTTGLKSDISVIQDSVAGANNQFNIFSRYLDFAFYRVFDASSGTISNTNSQGWYLANRVSGTETRNYKNNVLTTKVVSSGTINTSQIIVCAGGSVAGVAANFSDRENSFASIGDGLTDTQAVDFYNAIQTFQTSLSRQV